MDYRTLLQIIRGGLRAGTNADAGNIPGAVGGALQLGSGAANLLGYPGVSSAVGGLGGPLSLATGLATGNPTGSAIGGAQTASYISGLLGGPTISSLATPALSSAYMALPGATAESLAALGLGSGIGLGGAAALGPFALMAMGALSTAMGQGDMFSAMFGESNSQPAKQMREYGDYADTFSDLTGRRTQGASLFPLLDEMDTPEEILGGLDVAASGAHANTEPAAWNLSHRPSALPGFKTMDLSGWNARSPRLSGENWGAFTNLMDKAHSSGLDIGGHVGDWNLRSADGAALGERGGQNYDMNMTGNDYRTKIGYNNQAQFGLDGDWIGGDPGQTQEAQDIGNAVAGIGRHLGIDFKSRGLGDYENFNSDQLEGYGLTPGNYGTGILNYLRSFDPNVVNNPNWGKYTKALGDPSSLDTLTLTPRAPKTYVDLYPWSPDTSAGGGE